jgi:hypothetical protein
MARRAEDPRLARHSRAVLFGDFWEPLEETRARVAALAGQGVRGHLLQVIDPAEETLPYAAACASRRSRPPPPRPALIPRVEAVREVYAERLARPPRPASPRSPRRRAGASRRTAPTSRPKPRCSHCTRTWRPHDAAAQDGGTAMLTQPC